MNTNLNNIKVPLTEYKRLGNQLNCVYLIESLNGQKYVGKTLSFKHRISRYINIKCEAQKHLYNSLIKYGLENHAICILEKNIAEENLNDKEIHYINKFESNLLM